MRPAHIIGEQIVKAQVQACTVAITSEGIGIGFVVKHVIIISEIIVNLIYEHITSIKKVKIPSQVKLCIFVFSEFTKNRLSCS